MLLRRLVMVYVNNDYTGISDLTHSNQCLRIVAIATIEVSNLVTTLLHYLPLAVQGRQR